MAQEPVKIYFNRFLKDIFLTSKDKFCFILGSGASAASGIPTGLEMSRKWADYIKNEYTPEEIADYKKQLNIVPKNGVDPLDPNISENYFNLYYMRFISGSKLGYQELEKIMNDAEPSSGYHILARLLKDTKHNLVLTTNFDSLIEISLAQYAASDTIVFQHESLAKYIDVTKLMPIVVKLHRALFFNPQNMPSDVECLNEDWKKPLDRIFSIYTPIVIGYNGGDHTLMEYLEEENNLLNGLYWFKRKDSTLNERIKDLLIKRNGRLIDIEEASAFDYIMGEIDRVKGNKDTEDYLLKRKKSSIRKLDKPVQKYTKRQIPLKAIITKVGEALYTAYQRTTGKP